MGNMQPSVVLLIFIVIAVIAVLVLVISHLRRENEAILAQTQVEVSSVRSSAENQIASIRAVCDREKEELVTHHLEELNLVKQDCATKIRQMKEEIEHNKEVLSGMSEKELLINVMVALNGYSGRLQRLEQQLTEEKITEHINKQYIKITEKVDKTTKSLTEHINEMNDSLQQGINDSDIRQVMNSMVSELNSISSDNLVIHKEMDSLESAINEIHSSVCNKYSYDTVASDIDDVKNELSSIKSIVDEIYSSVSDEYSYDSLASHINEVVSAVNEAKEAAESARDASESTKEAIEFHYT